MKKFEFELSCLLSFGNDCYSHLTVRLEHFKQSKETCLLLPHFYPWHLDEFSCVMMRDSWDTIITTAKATATIFGRLHRILLLPEGDTQKSSLVNLTVTISVFKILNYLSRLIYFGNRRHSPAWHS